jgi:phage terminase large subunit-like protein
MDIERKFYRGPVGAPRGKPNHRRGALTGTGEVLAPPRRACQRSHGYEPDGQPPTATRSTPGVRDTVPPATLAIERSKTIDRLRYRVSDLRADQRAIARCDVRFKVVACGRRWGKTTLGLVMAVSSARRGRRVWWVAPTYGLAFHPWRALKSALFREWALKLEAERYIELKNGGNITVKSAEDPDGLRGVGLDALVIDEAAFVAEEAWTACLRPALADRRGRALMISTPKGRNWFYHAFERGRDPLVEDWRAWRYPSAANPLIGDREIADAHALMPDRIFKQEFEAEFMADGGEVFRNLEAAATAPIDVQPIPGHRYVMGVDFARYEDFTALVVIDSDEGVMVALDRFSEVNWGVQRARIAALARRWDVSMILAEANAMGEPNIEALRDQDLPIQGFTTTARSKPPLIEGLVVAIENEDLRLLPDPVLLGELESFAYRNTPFGTQYGAPPGRHDDTVIALALAWRLASVPRLTLAIAVV